MYGETLGTLRDELAERAHQGLGWMVVHVDDLRPAAAMTHWTSADSARAAAAECAVACRPLARLAPVSDRVYVGLLADWVEHLAVPELVAWSLSGAPAWYRPLVLTAGALAEWGVRVPALDAAVRTYGPPTAPRNANACAAHAIETAYWWAKVGDGSPSAAIDAACETEIARLAGEPMHAWTALALARTIVYQSDVGRMPDPVSRTARQLLRRASRVAAADGAVEPAAECAFAWWCLGVPWSDALHPLASCLLRARRRAGAFTPHLHAPVTGVNDTERGARATLVGVMGCLALAEILREHAGEHAGGGRGVAAAPVYRVPMETENTANAAQ